MKRFISLILLLLATLILLFVVTTFPQTTQTHRYGTQPYYSRTTIVQYNLPAMAIYLQYGVIIAEDGTRLGVICTPFDFRSIYNEYGEYGSVYSFKSIWNEYSIYGSEYFFESVYNPYTFTPPKIIKLGIHVGYVTKNKYLLNAIDPDILKALKEYY